MIESIFDSNFSCQLNYSSVDLDRYFWVNEPTWNASFLVSSKQTYCSWASSSIFSIIIPDNDLHRTSATSLLELEHLAFCAIIPLIKYYHAICRAFIMYQTYIGRINSAFIWSAYVAAWGRPFHDYDHHFRIICKTVSGTAWAAFSTNHNKAQRLENLLENSSRVIYEFW